ncbi:hypothetical protein EIL87_03125 [Saccharopolyspora rhizosphaerae]|uniref:Uncharacterized protein n=1 Tax=Saccharopolyspora rhizosphaerae TaxID=2492662 RepID=A0A3R8P4P5_9PSEU|nr:hypothetical protein [Saccharopolyspora rhizosphaerae]RRO19982.1 hypothetical protein EIL87_03125 [Saccharopolyspora rhizosphaerae]
MTALPHSTSEAALRDAVDTALIDLLTKPDDPADRAREELTRAVGLLDEHPQIDVSADAATAVRSAAEHLVQGEREDARTALVTARGRLSAPGSRQAARKA